MGLGHSIDVGCIRLSYSYFTNSLFVPVCPIYKKRSFKRVICAGRDYSVCAESSTDGISAQKPVVRTAATSKRGDYLSAQELV